VTVSIGVCIAAPGESPELIGRADQNVHEAKTQGRIASAPEPPKEVRREAAFSLATSVGRLHEFAEIRANTKDHCRGSRLIARNNDCKIEVLEAHRSMEIRFISSLTADDEDLFAPVVLKSISALLDQLPIAYTIRIETTGAQVYQHTHAPEPAAVPGHAARPASPESAVSHLKRGVGNPF